jgi:hypothetical protein
MIAYLNFKASDVGPFQTVSVPAKIKTLWWQDRGLSFTASGYGSRIPSRYMVQWAGRWRRVYVACWGNASSLWLLVDGQRVIVHDVIK